MEFLNLKTIFVEKLVLEKTYEYMSRLLPSYYTPEEILKSLIKTIEKRLQFDFEKLIEFIRYFTKVTNIEVAKFLFFSLLTTY